MKGKEKVIFQKKLLSLLMVVAILMNIIAVPIVQASVINVTIEDNGISLSEGSIIELPLRITGDSISSLEGYLSFDDNLFELTNSDVILTTGLNGSWVKYYDTVEKRITVYETGGNPNVIDNVIITFRLTVKEDITADTTFSIEDMLLVDEDYEGYEPGLISKVIEVGQANYDVTYNANTTDPVTGMPLNGVKSGEEDYTILGTPTRIGYNFMGWNTQADGQGTDYTVGDVYQTNAELNLFAKWQVKTLTLTVDPNGGEWESRTNSQNFPQQYNTTKEISDAVATQNGYTVGFNYNGGTQGTLSIDQTKSFNNWNLNGGGSIDNGTYTYGDEDATIKATYIPNNITLPDASREGYSFDGWYTEQVAGERIGGANDSYMPTSPTVLFAHWTINEHTVKYMPGTQGTFNEQSSVVNYGTNTPAFEGTPTGNVGFTFAGWNPEVADTVTGDVEYVAQWLADTDSTYTVEHYKQNVDGTYPTAPTEIESNLVGEIDGTVSATIKTYDGFVEDTTNANRVVSGIVANDGSLVLKVYYKAQYTITYKPGTQGTFTEQSYTSDYGATTPEFVGNKTANAGYMFTGWEPNVAETVTENAEYVAQWDNATNTPYKVEHYKQSITGVYPTEPTEIDNLQGVTNSGVTAINKNYDGYVEDTTNGNRIVSGTIAPDGSLVLKVYYKIQYNVTYKPGTQGTFEVQEYNVGVGATTPAFEGVPSGNSGYDFVGWDKNIATIVTEDVEYVAQWQIKTFNVSYNANTGTGAPASQTKTYNVDTTLSEVVPTREGFEFLKWNTMPNGTGANYLPGGTYSAEENVTLYAQWERSYSYYVQTDNDRIGFDTFDEAKEYMEDHLTDLPVITDKNGNVVDQVIDFGDSQPGNGTKEIEYYVKDLETDINTPANTFDSFIAAKANADDNNLKVYDQDGNIIYGSSRVDDLYITSDVYEKEDNIYFNEITEETTLEEFKENVETNGVIKVYGFDNEVLEDDELVGTGMILRVTKDNQVMTFMLVVEGDMDGNGKVTVTDLSMINKHLVEIKLLRRGSLKAADLSDDENVTITDLSAINQILVGR